VLPEAALRDQTTFRLRRRTCRLAPASGVWFERTPDC
jgi:hypothetical protein